MFKGLNVLFPVKNFQHKRTQLITIPIGLVYNTVLDVPSYHRFLPWCKGSHWIDQQKQYDSERLCGQRTAQLTVDYKLLKESYISKVSFDPCTYIKAVAADSELFETLDTIWEFKSQGDNTLIDFYITFKFQRDLYQTIFCSLSHVITSTMLEHFVQECRRRHGLHELSK